MLEAYERGIDGLMALVEYHAPWLLQSSDGEPEQGLVTVRLECTEFCRHFGVTEHDVADLVLGELERGFLAYEERRTPKGMQGFWVEVL